MPHARVRLVVLNFNGGDLTERAVEHLEALDWPAEQLDLVVVDNASHDGSQDRIEAAHPRVRVIRSTRNAGFPANNLGLGDLDGVDYVGLINNDAFVEPDYLTPLVEALDADPGLAAACPRIVLAPRFATMGLTAPTFQAPGDGRELSVRLRGVQVDGDDVQVDGALGVGCHDLEHDQRGPFRWLGGAVLLQVPMGAASSEPRMLRVELEAPADGTVVTLAWGEATATVSVGIEPTWFELTGAVELHDVINNVGSQLVEGGFGGDRGFLEVDAGQYEETEEVFAWCGAGVLFRPAYLRQVGLFDERFFMYYEDTDLSWRGRAQGWRYRYVPTSRMRHVHAATSVEGSPRFRFWVDRNRLFLLTKNAPAAMARRAVAGLAVELGRALGRDVVRPVLRLRRPRPGHARTKAKSLASYLVWAPAMLRDRRRLRRAQSVPDADLLAWAVAR